MTSLTKRKRARLALQKLGGYVEVTRHRPAEWARVAGPPGHSMERQWRRMGIASAVALAVLATLVWLRLVNFI